MDNLIKLMDAHGGVAAWVQSLGAILALALTIWLSRGDKRERDRISRARSRSAALTVFPELVDVEAELAWALHRIDQGAKPEEIDRTGPDDDEVSYFWRVNVMPPRLEELRPILWELGDAAAQTQGAFFALFQLRNRFRGFIATSQFDGPEETWKYSGDEWEATLKIARAALVRLEKAVNSIGTLLKE